MMVMFMLRCLVCMWVVIVLVSVGVCGLFLVISVSSLLLLVSSCVVILVVMFVARRFFRIVVVFGLFLFC